MIEDIKEQNKLLKDLLRLTVEILPRHSADCGVYRAHANSGESEISGFLYIPIDREVVGNIFETPELLKNLE